MKRKMLAFIAVLVVGGVVLIPTIGPRLISLTSSGSSEGEWPDYSTAERLMDDSDQIVIAKYLDDTEHVIPVISSLDGEQHGSVTNIYRRFEIVQSLKGDAARGETRYVVVTAGNTTEMGDGRLDSVSYEVVPLSQGVEYVLFLISYPRRPEYPAQYGDWTITGEPAFAQVDSRGNLSFRASDRYRKAHGVSGRSESASPFELTKQEIEAFVSSK